AAIPFITNVIPMILNNLAQWLQTSIFPQSDLPVWFLTVWSSAINPICTILLMSSYRKVIFNIFGSTSVPSKVSVIPRQTIVNVITH
uniref:Uncharacterized protein n=1 Tax=Panagrolaimus sp. PS1159 TaxID=55785 RepID=A0AC35FAQ0_9BILA